MEMNNRLLILGIAVLLICVGLGGCTSTIDEVFESSYGTCYYDFTFNESYYAGYYWVAPEGYKYAIATLCLKNEADHWVSTNPYYWKLRAGGIEYSHDTATYDEGIDHQDVKVYQGGNITTTIIFKIPEDVDINDCRIVSGNSVLTGIVDFERDDNLL